MPGASQVLWDLAQYLMDQTGPGKPWELPPNGILWTPIAPVPSQTEALARALKQQGYHIGILMPTADRKEEAVRSPYTDSQRGGTVREVQGYLTIFVRSMKGWPLDGAFADLPAWLDRVLRDYRSPGTHDTVRLGDFRYMGAGPDYFIMEGGFSFKYLIPAVPDTGPKVRGFRILSHPNISLRPDGWWFDVYLNP